MEVPALLTAWRWRFDVVAVLIGLAAGYVRGWVRLRRGERGAVPGWRLACYLGGLGALAVALLSPVAALAGVLFSVHMIQHQLVSMVAAPLLLLGNPLPATLWGLPPRLRRATGHLLRPGAPVRRALGVLTALPVAGGAYVLTLWAWHWPAAYQASLRFDWLHDVQHVSFFVTSVLFWWPVVAPAPRLRRRDGLGYGLAIAYLIATTAQNTLLGAILSLADRVLYPAYAAAPRLFGLTVLDDQALAGGIMWSAGHMYLIAILVLVHHALTDRDPVRGSTRERPRRDREASAFEDERSAHRVSPTHP